MHCRQILHNSITCSWLRQCKQCRCTRR